MRTVTLSKSRDLWGTPGGNRTGLEFVGRHFRRPDASGEAHLGIRIEGRCERTARLPVSRSSTAPERLLWGRCVPILESTVRLSAGRSNNREVLEGSIAPDAIGGCTVPCISSAHEPCGALSREEPFRRFR